MNKWKKECFLLITVSILFLSGCSSEVRGNFSENQDSWEIIVETEPTVSIDALPAYSGEPYITIANNIPNFADSDLKEKSFEIYSDLDDLGRCGVAFANIGPDLMPTEDRDSISQVKPSGWHTVKYDCVDGKYLYNRCHLIGFQLTSENANTQNLITGTRYLNIEGMLPFENMVADYIKETGNHVLYRVTPVYDGDNLVASGVQIEAKSVEDNGDAILFNIYCYNVQPGITIDYTTGESQLGFENSPPKNTGATENSYILNTNTKKFHLPSCSSLNEIKNDNKTEFLGTRDDLIQRGYSPCKRCNP